MALKLALPKRCVELALLSQRLLILLTVTAVSVTWSLRQPAGTTSKFHATPASYPPGGTPAVLGRTPIQDIRLGQRVIAFNPLRVQVDRSLPEPDEATWRKLSLRMRKPDGKKLDVVLLRPTDWIAAAHGEVGKIIELHLAELGAEGPAEVISIESSPPIESGDGKVVTGLFRHESSHQVLDVGVEGEAKSIGVTANHLFWSEARRDFVPAGELQIGEAVQTLEGVRSVVSISPRGPPEPVYNLEVHSEHVYRIAECGILVHNAYIYRSGRPSPGNLTPRAGEEALSFRGSLSNPISSAQRPVFRPGDDYIVIDTNKLPAGSVIFDDLPPGHVSVRPLPLDVLKGAVVDRGKFPK